MSVAIPRVVIVTRPTEYESLIATHATRGQAEFYLKLRGQSIDDVEKRHRLVQQALQQILASIPKEWRRNHIQRHELDRFVFEPDDLLIAVGQDGLVANMAKYLDNHYVIGVNPDKERNEGVLVPFSSYEASQLIEAVMAKDVDVQHRTMARVTLDDGQSLTALNEIFIGHRSHQSARYVICKDSIEERQSSSGIIITTGTGATGWAKSIGQERNDKLSLPAPEEASLAFYVREAFPSIATGTQITSGIIVEAESITIRSENNEGGVIFGDGIEDDYLAFNWGMKAVCAVADKELLLVKPHDL